MDYSELNFLMEDKSSRREMIINLHENSFTLPPIIGSVINQTTGEIFGYDSLGTVPSLPGVMTEVSGRSVPVYDSKPVLVPVRHLLNETIHLMPVDISIVDQERLTSEYRQQLKDDNIEL